MGSYADANAKCPFYRREDLETSSLTCEGVLPGSTMRSHFGTKANLRRQEKKYCVDDYESCPWYRIVNFKWEMIDK